MEKIDYSKLKEYDAEPILELEQQLRDRIKREAEASEEDEKKKRKKKKRSRT